MTLVVVLDISILEIGDGVFEVKATNGDTHLGGDNWDSALIDFFVEAFQKNKALTCAWTRWHSSAFKEEGEKAKIAIFLNPEYGY